MAEAVGLASPPHFVCAGHPLMGVRTLKLRNAEFIKFDRQFPIYNFFYPSQGASVSSPDLEQIYGQQEIITSRSLYFHIPFCETICSFCPFTRGKYSSDEQVESYTAALVREIELKSMQIDLKKIPIKSIFFGGGTPSLLNASQIRRLGAAINAHFDLSQLKEFSFEIEVKSLDLEKANAMCEIGVSHPRFGLQTFNEGWRKKFHLTASLEDVYRASEILIDKFPFQSFDILYGMNGQDETEIISDIESAVKVGTTNIDLYPIDNVMTQVTLHREIDRAGFTRTSATRKFAMNVLIDQVMRHSGFMPHNGHGYVRTDATSQVVTENYSFVYHESVYGYHDWDLMGFGTNAISSTFGYVITNSRNRENYINEVLSGAIPFSVSKHDVSNDFARPIILRLPYHGRVAKRQLEIDKIPYETIIRLKELIAEGLVVEKADSFELTKLGWYWYVNVMYYLMPRIDQVFFNNLVHKSMKNPLRTITRDEIIYNLSEAKAL